MAYPTFLIDVLVLLVFLATIQSIYDYRRRGGLSYPPGPRPLPIVGNLRDVPKRFPWLAYTQFSKTYGTPLSFSKTSSDSDRRGYHVFPHFWTGYRRLELDSSCQGRA
jgi:hypothetical protein